MDTRYYYPVLGFLLFTRIAKILGILLGQTTKTESDLQSTAKPE